MARVLFIVTILMFSLAQAAPDRFIPGFDDMPLMEGLQLSKANHTVFDHAEGRILDIKANGFIRDQAVRDYYHATLPQLGWHPLSSVDQSSHWQREDEHLTLRIFAHDDGRTWVHFLVTPEI